ncbi:hypothetical protein E1A91_A04G140900v1 [Gossypium mustelinum]|uniref:Uncharacterized protein n=1 Tax=Gossypium mustelinum TaxID=34275 RepID=A0A5D2ZP74_GOSMU|nr:hypothetical protein E1A91_A04G140900v1 [Gossypium mustelinum]
MGCLITMLKLLRSLLRRRKQSCRMENTSYIGKLAEHRAESYVTCTEMPVSTTYMSPTRKNEGSEQHSWRSMTV